MNSLNRDNKQNGWEQFECNGLHCSHERSDKHYVIEEADLNQAILSAEENLLREIMEEMPNKMEEIIVGAFLDVAGTVWGIDAPDRRWTDKQMIYFNVKVVKIRDKTIDQVNTLLESKLSTVKRK